MRAAGPGTWPAQFTQTGAELLFQVHATLGPESGDRRFEVFANPEQILARAA
jgi:hypothetical protein